MTIGERIFKGALYMKSQVFMYAILMSNCNSDIISNRCTHLNL